MPDGHSFVGDETVAKTVFKEELMRRRVVLFVGNKSDLNPFL